MRSPLRRPDSEKGPRTPPVDASTLTSVQGIGKPGGKAAEEAGAARLLRGGAAAASVAVETIRHPCVVLELQKSVWICGGGNGGGGGGGWLPDSGCF